MSLSGIDFGNCKSVVAVVQNKSVIVVEDDQGKRETPSVISFVGKRRLIGVLGKSEKNRNLSNTIIHPKSILSSSFPHHQTSRTHSSTRALRIKKNSRDELCVVIDYKSSVDQNTNKQEDLELSKTQIGGIMFAHLRSILELRTEQKEHKCVLAYPIHFTESKRRCFKIAAEISGLKPVSIISESRAICLAYACGRTGLPKETERPRTVLFADFGHTHFTATIGDFNTERIHIRSVSSDPTIGSCLIDDLLFEHVCSLIKDKYQFNLLDQETTDPKPIAKLMDSVIKAKETLSINPKSARINIDSLYNDTDISINVNGQDFRKLCEPVYQKIINVILTALGRARIKTNQIDFIEVVGGSSRIPSFKTKISDFFGKNVSTTLNSTECIAQGCAYQSLLLFPNNENGPKFQIIDFNLYPIALTLKNLTQNEIQKEMLIEKEKEKEKIKEKEKEKEKENENENENETEIEIEKENDNKKKNEKEKEKEKIMKIKNDWIEEKIEINKNNSINLVNYGEIPTLNGGTQIKKNEINSPFQIQIQYPPKDIYKNTIPELKHISENEQLIQKNIIMRIPKLNYKDEKGIIDVQFEIDDYGLVNIKSICAYDQPIMEKKLSFQNSPYTRLQFKQYSNGGYRENEIARLIKNEFKMNEENQRVIDRLVMKNELESYLYFVQNSLEKEWRLFIQEEEGKILKKHLKMLENWIYNEGSDVSLEKYSHKNEELIEKISPIKQRIYERLNRPKVIQQFLKNIECTENNLKNKKFTNLKKNDSNKLFQICQIYRKWIKTAMKNQRRLKINQDPTVRVKDIQLQMNRFLEQLNNILNQK
ncbi:hypothetical protein M0813_16596 [Anaeramoeba flamelloides]|uniref:Uncharacterized protein n=1 Tax=Anaeramoeba flamelloides TaxID=1746091 RepID=A0ABQ8YZC5_9EUKA|nr:hypothetical protein M0813_16596 [Anaeramoeba flamelloides]